MPEQPSSFLASRNKYYAGCYHTTYTQHHCYTITQLYYTILRSHPAPYPFIYYQRSLRYTIPQSQSVASPLSINHHHPVCRGRQFSPQRLSHQSKLPSHPLLLCPNPLLRDLKSPCPCAALQTPPRRVRSTPLSTARAQHPHGTWDPGSTARPVSPAKPARRFRIDS